MSTLQKLETRQIVAFQLNADKTALEVRELCDGYYETTLSAPEVKTLVKELAMLCNKMNTPDISLELFQEINEIELTCIFAESGLDRELDFDRESEEEKLYYSQEFPHLIRKGL